MAQHNPGSWPAFPRPMGTNGGTGEERDSSGEQDGMTFRQYASVHFMQSFIVADWQNLKITKDDGTSFPGFAWWAVAAADALIEELEKD